MDEDWKKGLTPWQLLESAIRDKVAPGDPGDLALAEEALALGADPNARVNGWTALMYAAIEDDAAMVEWLFAHGARPDDRAVMEAARFDAARACAALIAHGCGVEHDEHGDSPVIVAARERRKAVLRVLVAAGADLERQDDSGTCARDYIARGGRTER